MIIPFITDLINEPAADELNSISSKSAEINDGNYLRREHIFSGKFSSMMNNMEQNTSQAVVSDKKENIGEKELSFNERYNLILKRIEKERFERELIAGSR